VQHLHCSGRAHLPVLACRCGGAIEQVPFSRVRTAVTAGRDDAYLTKTLIPYTALGNLGSRTIRAAVTAVKRNAVELDNGESVSFDYAVLAMGATYNGAGVIATSLKTVAERKEELKAAAQKILDAKSIAVVGGGATGIEVHGFHFCHGYESIH
jgi:NADH dehydrogenase FAD-containing subunit